MDPAQVANVDQARAWDGEEGAHWVAHAARYDAATPAYTARLAEIAAVRPDEIVLDIGCGNGQSTRIAARAASRGRVVGIDLSAAMLDHARAEAAAAGLTNVEHVQGDAQVFAFEPASFDVAISRFGSMFFADPVVAFRNIARALRPGGRLALVVWQAMSANEWFREIGLALAVGRPTPDPPPGTPSPFGLSSPEFVREVLTAAGFTDVAVEPSTATFHAGADADDAFAFVSSLGFTRFRLQDLDADQARAALDALRETLRAHQTEAGVVFESAAWLVTARRA